MSSYSSPGEQNQQQSDSISYSQRDRDIKRRMGIGAAIGLSIAIYGAFMGDSLDSRMRVYLGGLGLSGIVAVLGTTALAENRDRRAKSSRLENDKV